jgi:hypothetical protein
METRVRGQKKLMDGVTLLLQNEKEEKLQESHKKLIEEEFQLDIIII